MISLTLTMRRAVGVAIASFAVFATGCGPSGGYGDPPESTVAFVCERSFIDFGDGIDLYSQTGTVADPRVYTELFARDADGRYSVRLLSRNGKELDDLGDGPEKEEFEIWSQRFATGFGAFIANVRDFSVRNHELFAENYDWIKVSDFAVIAGRKAMVAEVRSIFADRPWYRIWSDKKTHVPLKIKEFTASGALACEMEVTAIEFEPDLLDEQFADLSFVEQSEASYDQMDSFAGFQRFEPAYLPAGFVGDSTRVAMVSGIPVVVQTWTDGVVELMLTQYGELSSELTPTPSDYPGETFTSVRVERNGLTRDAQFQMYGTQVHLSAKLSKDEFVTVLESLIPAE